MLSIAKAQKDYYLRKLGEISLHEDYYLRGGTAKGRWRGSGADELGLQGTVSTEGLVRLFDGQHPATGEQLGRRIRKDGVAAWDLTFSADKSVSLLWAFGGDEVRRHVLEAFEESTAEALTYLESVASSTRGAARTAILDQEGKPMLDEDGFPRHRVETWPIRSKGYVSAWFTEFTSRGDDPQIHTHVVVGNRVEGVDDVWRAIDGRLLYRHKLAAGYLHEAELRSRLTERLGVRWQPVHDGIADIEGFTRDQIMAFSQRRQEIEAWRDSRDLPDTAAANEVATLATRSSKKDHSLDSLMPVWLERGAEVGVTAESVASLVGRSHEVTMPEPEPVFDRLASAEGLTAQASTFGRAEVIKAAAEAHPEGGKRTEIEALAETFLRQPEVVAILPSYAAVDAADDLPIEFDPIELERGDGYVIARHLANAKLKPCVIICGQKEKVAGDALINLKIIEKMPIPIEVIDMHEGKIANHIKEITAKSDLIVDAIFGTGLRGDLRPPYIELIDAINSASPPIIAVDIPSGLDCDLGTPLPTAIKATATVTFVAVKKGFKAPKAKEYTSQIYVASIGIEP